MDNNVWHEDYIDRFAKLFALMNIIQLYTLSRRADLIVWECDTDLDVLQPATQDSHNPLHKKGRKEKIDKEEEEEMEEEKQNKIKYKRIAK